MHPCTHYPLTVWSGQMTAATPCALALSVNLQGAHTPASSSQPTCQSAVCMRVQEVLLTGCGCTRGYEHTTPKRCSTPS